MDTNNKIRYTLALLFVLFTTGQTIWAQSTFTVSNDNDEFVITRSNTSGEETVRYRTVSRSAIQNKHFTPRTGTLVFADGEQKKTISVPQISPASDYISQYFNYMDGNTRKYRFEVLDPMERTVLAYYDKELTYTDSHRVYTTYINSSINNLVIFETDNSAFSSGLPSNKYYEVPANAPNANSVTDAGYGQDVYTIDLAPFFDHVCSSNKYLSNIGDKLYATVCFTQREEYDGYQYIQILTNNSSTYDGNDPIEEVYTPDKSLYKACWELGYYPDKPGTVISTEYHMFFPHKSNNHISGTEFDFKESHMYRQRFKDDSYRASTSGSLVLSPYNLQTINVRFDAAGNGKDTWHFRDLFARVAVLDDCAPTLLSEPITTVSHHYRGNTETITVPFNEIVKVTGKPTITTTWGKFTYVAGSGTNALTFTGTIDALPGTALSVTNLKGTVKDMVGNAFTWSGTQNSTAKVGTTYTLDDFDKDNEGHYLITRKEDLLELALMTSTGVLPQNKVFIQTANITCDNTFKPIGTIANPFHGTYDGCGFTISGITVNTPDVNGIGIFGAVGDATIKNVVLSSSTFTGNNYVGGIVGHQQGGTLQNCLISNNVTINATGTDAGAIVGKRGATLIANYYRGCTVNSVATNVGTGNGDIDGARSLHLLLIDKNITVSGESIVISDQTYYAAGATVTITYSGSVPEGKLPEYRISDGLNTQILDGNSFIMPAYNTILGATIIDATLPLTAKLVDGHYWTTFYNGMYRYILPAEAAAYTMSNDYHLYRLGTDGSVIPAKTAVVIISDRPDITLTRTHDNTPVSINSGTNLLLGSDNALTLTDGKVNGMVPIVMGIVDNKLGFYPYTADAIPAGKAYYPKQQIVSLADLPAGKYTAQDGDVLTGTVSKAVEIDIAAGATVTLYNADINGNKQLIANSPSIKCLGDATIIITGTNIVQAYKYGYPGIMVGKKGTTLTICGIGSLTAIGQGNYNNNGYTSGPGIGGQYNSSCGNIVIESGTIFAQGGNGAAGIGSGSTGSTKNTQCGNITITGGTVTAIGGSKAAGIGTGVCYRNTDGVYQNQCGNITITGGTVIATGGNGGAAIGGGFAEKRRTGDPEYCKVSCGTITITKDVTRVEATRGDYDSYCIGEGSKTGSGSQSCGTITIGGVDYGTRGVNPDSSETYVYEPAH